MGAVLLMVGMTTLLLVLSVVFLCGHGSFLIAGYNTLSKEQKARFDEKKLCRCMGICMLFITLLLGMLTYFCFRVESGAMPEEKLGDIAWIFILGVLAAIATTMGYSNTRCKKK